jgi:hypothetical protein
MAMKNRSTDADCQSVKSIVKPAGVAAIMRAKNCRAFNCPRFVSSVGRSGCAGAARFATTGATTDAAATEDAATEDAATEDAATDAAATEDATTDAAATDAPATEPVVTDTAALCDADGAGTAAAAIDDSAGTVARTTAGAAGTTGVGGSDRCAVAPWAGRRSHPNSADRRRRSSPNQVIGILP